MAYRASRNQRRLPRAYYRDGEWHDPEYSIEDRISGMIGSFFGIEDTTGTMSGPTAEQLNDEERDRMDRTGIGELDRTGGDWIDNFIDWIMGL